MKINRSFAARSIARLKRVRPALLARLALGAALASPAWGAAYFLSRPRIRRWKDPRVVKRFMERHRLFFEGVDESTLRIETLPGGVSNCNFVWSFRTLSGKEVQVCIKLFLPMGSVWARLLPALSPFPPIEPVSRRQRLAADALTRTQLIRRQVPVPDVFIADPAECVTVSEYVRGEPLTRALLRIARQGDLSGDDQTLLWKCGAVLARIHAAGFSVIDAQPANCLWVAEKKELYMLDFEYGTRSDYRGWDLSFFGAFLCAQLSGSLRARAQELFRQGYLDSGGSDALAFEVESRGLEDFLPLFQIILDLRSFTPEKLAGLEAQPVPSEIPTA